MQKQTILFGLVILFFSVVAMTGIPLVASAQCSPRIDITDTAGNPVGMGAITMESPALTQGNNGVSAVPTAQFNMKEYDNACNEICSNKQDCQNQGHSVSLMISNTSVSVIENDNSVNSDVFGIKSVGDKTTTITNVRPATFWLWDTTSGITSAAVNVNVNPLVLHSFYVPHPENVTVEPHYVGQWPIGHSQVCGAGCSTGQSCVGGFCYDATTLGVIEKDIFNRTIKPWANDPVLDTSVWRSAFPKVATIASTAIDNVYDDGGIPRQGVVGTFTIEPTALDLAIGNPGETRVGPSITPAGGGLPVETSVGWGVAFVSVTPSAVYLPVGGTQVPTATVIGTYGGISFPAPNTWSSTNDGVAFVGVLDCDGNPCEKISVINPGTANISASFDAEPKIPISPAVVNSVGIIIGPDPGDMMIGDTANLTADANIGGTPITNPDIATIEWSSSNDKVATVTPDVTGYYSQIEAVGGGTATIVASFSIAMKAAGLPRVPDVVKAELPVKVAECTQETQDKDCAYLNECGKNNQVYKGVCQMPSAHCVLSKAAAPCGVWTYKYNSGAGVYTNNKPFGFGMNLDGAHQPDNLIFSLWFNTKCNNGPGVNGAGAKCATCDPAVLGDCNSTKVLSQTYRIVRDCRDPGKGTTESAINYSFPGIGANAKFHVDDVSDLFMMARPRLPKEFESLAPAQIDTTVVPSPNKSGICSNQYFYGWGSQGFMLPNSFAPGIPPTFNKITVPVTIPQVQECCGINETRYDMRVARKYPLDTYTHADCSGTEYQDVMPTMCGAISKNGQCGCLPIAIRAGVSGCSCSGIETQFDCYLNTGNVCSHTKDWVVTLPPSPGCSCAPPVVTGGPCAPGTPSQDCNCGGKVDCVGGVWQPCTNHAGCTTEGCKCAVGPGNNCTPQSCCPSGTFACGTGPCCTTATQTCLNGACCPNTQVCGSTCCDPGQICDPKTVSCTSNPNPTTLAVTCTASPTSIAIGDSSTFTATPTGGTAGVYGYDWTGACSGSSKTCTNTFSDAGTEITAIITVTSGLQTASADCSVDVGQPIPALTVTCSANPNPIQVGDSSKFTATPNGGTGVYGYAWTGTGAGACTGSAKTCTKTFSATQTETVTVISGLQTASANCSVVVNPIIPPIICPPGQTLVGDACCDNTQVCNGGTVCCPTGLFCKNNSCSSSTPVTCPPGQTLVNGSCCGDTNICGNGSNASCCDPALTICAGGSCCPTARACANDICCGAGTTCTNGSCAPNTPPVVDNLRASGPFCPADTGIPGGGLATFSWNYPVPPNKPGSEEMWQIQISTSHNSEQDFEDHIVYDYPEPNSSTNTISIPVYLVMKGLRNSTSACVAASSPGVPRCPLNYNANYYWRVRVWDSDGTSSGWVYYVDANAPTPDTFTYGVPNLPNNPPTIFANPGPEVSYDISPSVVKQGSTATFTDTDSRCFDACNGDNGGNCDYGVWYFCHDPTKCYDANGNPDACPSDPPSSLSHFTNWYHWEFYYNSTCPPSEFYCSDEDYTEYTTSHVYNEPTAAFSTSLTITNRNNPGCYATKPLTTKINVAPQWKEISPY